MASAQSQPNSDGTKIALSGDNSDKQEDMMVAERDVDDEKRPADIITSHNPSYPKGFQLFILTCGLMLVVLIIALDNYIIATAIPSITTTFQSLDDVGWYGSSYFLTQMAFQPFFGKLYTHFHIKTVFASAIVVFEVGSILAAAAVTSPMFIIGRAIAGVGGGGLFVGVIVMVGYAVVVSKRPLYVSLVTSMYGVASVVGPLLGGVFTDSPRLTWRFCFWINLPIGFISFITITMACRSPDRKPSTLSFHQKVASLDFGGVVLLISAFICLLLAMQWGGVHYPWSDSHVWGTILGFALIIMAFALLQIKLKQRASLPVRIFSNRTVVFGFLYTTTINVAVGVAVYWIPLYYQSVLAFSAVNSGINTIPYLTPLLFAPIISGFSISRFGYYVPFMWFSGICVTIGTGLLIIISPTTSTAYIIGALVLAGFGAGFGRQIALSAFQHVLPPADIPIASALFSFGVALGGTLATCLSQAVFFNRFKGGLIQIPGITPEIASSIVASGATDLGVGLSGALLDPVRGACAKGIAGAFVLGTAFAGLSFFCTLGMKWANIKH